MKRYKKRTKVIVSAAILILVCAMGLILFLYLKSKDNIIPQSDKKEIDFVVYWPSDSLSNPQKSTVKYDAKTGVLSYIDYLDSHRVVINQQATPSVFNDFSNYYSTLINHLNNYETLSTNIGNVYLTLPPNSNNSDTAVSNNHGTLLFASSPVKLTDSEWLHLFNGFKVLLN